MRKVLGEGPLVGHATLITRMAASNSVFQHKRYELSEMARLRNAIVHTPERPDGEPIAEPHEDIVSEYENLVDHVLRPALVIDRCVPADRIFSIGQRDRVVEVIRTMAEEVYTHAPLLTCGKVTGVFSENTIFQVVAHGKIVICPTTQVEELEEFLPIEKHASEIFEFVPRTATVIDIALKFQQRLGKKQRIGALFITENGSPFEPMLGLITAWDTAGVLS